MTKVITSKISLQYKAIIPGGLAMLIFIDYLVINAYKQQQYPPLGDTTLNRYYFFTIIIIVFGVIILGVLFRPEKITISDYGILFHGNILKKQFHISREDIAGVSTKQQTKSIKGAVEYYGNVLRIELKNGESAYISDSNYENYDALKFAIYEYLRQPC